MGDIKFGTINVETGETTTGYVDRNGTMKYRKLPWYKRIFFKEPTTVEIIGTITVEYGFIWEKSLSQAEVVVRREYNNLTNKTKKIWCSRGQKVLYFDAEYYDETKKLIEL